MKLIIGLGNPGGEHAGNRHNIGFMAADAIHERHDFPPWKAKFSGLIADGSIDGGRALLVKPQTYMNRSGDCVGKAARFYKVEAPDITVLYDELDLAPGKVRVKVGGGTGGHNGLRSIEPVIGNSYRRVRLGIGHPGHRDLVTRHVLNDFTKADAEWLEPLLAAIADNAALLLEGDDANFMNRLALAVNGSSRPTVSEKPKTAPRKQSHIRQARQAKPAPLPKSGPMAAMLKKLFNTD